MNIEDFLKLFLRYLFLVIIALPGMLVFYVIFTPLTIYPVYWILGIFFDGITLSNSSLVFNSHSIQIIPACIAGSAYYLLLVLNLATPMKPLLRIKSISFTILSLLALNILRIVVFAALFITGFQYFDFTHKLVWNLGSTVLVFAIWFANVYLFRIKAIPGYTDLKNIFHSIKGGKK
jgi:exosortase/archaeosortase family protein